jgi:peptide chain release factor 2
MAAENFWENRELAQKTMEEASSLRSKLEAVTQIDRELADLWVLLELCEIEPEHVQLQNLPELEQSVQKLQKDISNLEIRAFLSGPIDQKNAIISINAGAGGTESCDWAAMLFRMYQRWITSRGWEIEINDVLPGEVAGIKSATFTVKGPYAYGYCKAERGVHRLVRISPFDANHRRHTSFASVDVIAEIDEPKEISVSPNELKIETFRSSGKGGQNVNKVETAVRITHIPTGIVVTCRNERSQHQNRATAMKLLLSKLYAKRLDEQKAEMERFYGEKGSISWGNQIRSYVLHPYKMVKDLRTGYTTSDAEGVLDGALDPFVEAWFRAGCPSKRMQGIRDEEEGTA